MNKHPFALLFAAALLAAPAPAQDAAPSPGPSGGAPSATPVYERVYEALSALPHRRVGSPELDRAFAAVSNELAAAGLSPRYETFDSLAQVTERLSLTYGGAPVGPEGVHLIDNGPASFVLPEPIRGPAVYVSNDSLREIDGKDLRGAVAVLDAQLPEADVEESFVHGARAVVLVGGPGMDQWRLSKIAFT